MFIPYLSNFYYVRPCIAKLVNNSVWKRKIMQFYHDVLFLLYPRGKTLIGCRKNREDRALQADALYNMAWVSRVGIMSLLTNRYWVLELSHLILMRPCVQNFRPFNNNINISRFLTKDMVIHCSKVFGERFPMHISVLAHQGTPSSTQNLESGTSKE